MAEVMAAAGVYRFGIARAEVVEEAHLRALDDFITTGAHAGMTYMERYRELRADPRTLLDGAQSVISCAIPYYSPSEEPALPISRYARGEDYHSVVRRRLESVAEYVRERYGGETRVCVDTAPLLERYWAMASGVGFIGRNRQLIIPGAGSYFFLGEILTTTALEPTPRLDGDYCGVCSKCIDNCPTGALSRCGVFDASRCLSYLTIEHRGPLPEGADLHGCFYGCDRCAEVCPHNHRPPTTAIAELRPRQTIMELTKDDIAAMDYERYAEIFRGSAMKRAKLAGLLRNLRQLYNPMKSDLPDLTDSADNNTNLATS